MNGGLDFRDLSGAILRRWAFVLALVAVAMGAAWVLTDSVKEQYEATATVLAVQQPAGATVTQTDRGTNEQLALTFADVGRGPSVLEPAASELRTQGGWKALQRRIAIRLVPQTLLLEISARASSPDRAEQMADTVSRYLVSFTDGLSPFRQVQVQRARANPDHVAPNKTMNVLMAGALAFLVASAGAICFDLARTRRREAMSRHGLAPHLGTLDVSVGAPGRRFRRRSFWRRVVGSRRTNRPANRSNGGAPDYAVVGDAATVLLNLRAGSVGLEMRDLAVIGAPELPLRQHVAASLAVALSQVSNTVLVDLDLRRRPPPDGEAIPGVVNFLASQASNEPLALAPTRLPRLRILPAGSGVVYPVLALWSHALERLVEALRERADVIVYELPAGEQLAEVVLLSTAVDAVIVVVRARRIRAVDLSLVDRLSQAGVDVAGFVTFRVTRRWLRRSRAHARLVDGVLKDLNRLTPHATSRRSRSTSGALSV